MNVRICVVAFYPCGLVVRLVSIIRTSFTDCIQCGVVNAEIHIHLNNNYVQNGTQWTNVGANHNV